MDQALIENAEDDVDDKERCGDKDGRTRQCCSERLGIALKTRLQRERLTQRLFSLLDRADRLTDSGAGRKVERDCHRRELALMVDDERGDLHHTIDQSGQWHLLPT